MTTTILTAYDCGVIKLALIIQLNNFIGRRDDAALLNQKSTGLDDQIEDTKQAIVKIDFLLMRTRNKEFKSIGKVTNAASPK